ncbi:MAG: hypothetical protein WCT04_10040 [Planctomycetota bacterium]
MASSAPNKNSKSNESDLIDKDISFDNRDMHKSWPMIKGCLILVASLIAFVFFSLYIFRTFKEWFQ